MYYSVVSFQGFPEAGRCRPAAVSEVEAREGDMYSRKINVQYRKGVNLQPCPIKWIDNFSMRNFTNDQIFDDTLPVADGLLEIGARVPLDRLQAAMEDWFRRKGYLGEGAKLELEEAK